MLNNAQLRDESFAIGWPRPHWSDFFPNNRIRQCLPYLLLELFDMRFCPMKGKIILWKGRPNRCQKSSIERDVSATVEYHFTDKNHMMQYDPRTS
jgi:hypothetical protein